MKSIFYTQLLSSGDIPIGARIVYSQMVFRAITQNDAFDTDATFDAYNVRMNNNSWCDYFFCDTDIAKDLNCDKRTIVSCKEKLSELGVLDLENNRVFIREGMLDRFFELHPKTGLKSWELIVFSYIRQQTKKYRAVDTYRNKLSAMFGISETQLSHIISSLTRRNLIKREQNWKNWRLSCTPIISEILDSI